MNPTGPKETSSNLTRREAIATLAAGAVVAATGPFIHAEDKTGGKLPIVGSGEHTYECIHEWCQPPESVRWLNTHGVAVDSDGLIYIKHQSGGPTPMDTIVVYDPAGKIVRSFGKEYHQGGHGIDIRQDGNEEFLYLSDVHNRQAVKTTKTGEVVWSRPFPKEANVYKNASGYRPTNIAFNPDGSFYVADGYGSNYIHHYDKDAKWLKTWGGTGKEPGKMQTPHGIWLDNRPGREPALIIADRANARLQYFDLEGKFLSIVEGVLYPAHFDIRGDVLLVPDLHARVSLFDKDNNVIVHLGDDEAWRKEVLDGFKVRADPSRWKPGKFIHPHDACFDAEGNIFVVEWVDAGRITKLRRV
jgi:hypothetical protein